MEKLEYTNILDNQKAEVVDYMLKFLEGHALEDLILSDEKKLHTFVNDEGNLELTLVGKFIPQDSIKNQLAKGNIEVTTLLESTSDESKLVIGTHERVDGVFNDLKALMRDNLSWSDLDKFEEIGVSEHDFFGKGFVVASLNYKVNKFNRVALND